MENTSGSERIASLVEVSWNDDEHDTYRSKLAGIFGLIVAVNILMKIEKISTGGAEIGCDGLSSSQRSFWNEIGDISSSQAHFDILSGLYGLKREMDTTWRYRHIAGHQEDMTRTILDKWALLNIECDNRAWEYWIQLGGSRRRRTFGMDKGM